MIGKGDNYTCGNYKQGRSLYNIYLSRDAIPYY